jgi:putative hydrolase of the HAD superfamily
MITHLVFDFFGTLVQYSSGHFSGKPFLKTYQFLAEHNLSISYDEFTQKFTKIFQAFERRSKETLNEFHMFEVVSAFFMETFKINLDPGDLRQFTEVYLQEWNLGTKFLPGIQAFIASLSSRYSLSILSNTHYPDLIHHNLKIMEIQDYFPQVITSIEFGKRKPHPAIFQEALIRHQIDASQAIYIGDTYEDDYLGARNLQIRAILIDSQRTHLHTLQDRVDSLFEIQDLLTRPQLQREE